MWKGTHSSSGSRRSGKSSKEEWPFTTGFPNCALSTVLRILLSSIFATNKHFFLRGDSVSSEIANAWKIRVLAHCVRKMDYKGKKLDGFSRDIRINFDGMTALAVLFVAAGQQAGLGLVSWLCCAMSDFISALR